MDARLIKSRLERISNLDDRRMMKRVLNEVFGEVADYNMKMYEKLEKRIYDEIEDPLDGLYIYSGLINKADADPISGFFHPVISDDLENELFNMSEISQKINTEETELFLKDSDNNIIHTYTLNIKTDVFSLSSYEEINTEYADRILQDDIDDIADNEIKIFMFAYKDKWGFYVLPVLRKEQKLYIGSKKYYPFEHDEWERNFFDGRK